METYMSLSTSCLAIGKTCSHATIKNGLHQRFSCEPEVKEIVVHQSCSLTNKESPPQISTFCKWVITCRQLHLWLFHQMKSRNGKLGCPSTWWGPLCVLVREPTLYHFQVWTQHQFPSCQSLQYTSIQKTHNCNSGVWHYLVLYVQTVMWDIRLYLVC